MCLGIVVLMMNIYVFWYHVDPPMTEYAGGRYTTRRPTNYDSDDSDDYYYNRKKKSNRFEKAVSTVGQGLQHMSPMAGMPMPSYH
mmetsp:Transcript_19188/g.29395  ORF Transcript_19188/g.29395 Transcript_19188/m.29395 type:complete len:85 (+) Transcript_19188:2290-2544(+)